MPPSSKRTAASFDDSEATRRVKFRSEVDQRSQSISDAKKQRRFDDDDASDSEEEDALKSGTEKAVRVGIRSAYMTPVILTPHLQLLSFHSFQQRIGAAFYESQTSTLSFLEDAADSSMFDMAVARKSRLIIR
jgi:hypothetical protein